MINVNNANAHLIIKEVKTVQSLAHLCADEAKDIFKKREISKDEMERWINFQSEIDRHAIHVENIFTKNPSDENGFAGEISWLRSLARKLDYFNTKNIAHASALESAVDKLFVATIP